MTIEALSVYYAEQKAKIGVIEVSVKPELDSKVPILISASDVFIAKTRVPILAGTKIRKSEVSNVTVTDNVINVRIPTDPFFQYTDNCTPASDDTKVVSIACLRCLQILSCKPFSRTLPLPSAAWYEMTDTLICHGSHKTDPCNPRPGDCLIGEQEIWASWNNMDAKKVYFGSSRDIERHGVGRVTSSLNCHRCRNLLGRAVYNGDKVDFAILWKHSVSSNRNEDMYHIESYIARELLDSSTRNLCYRFIVTPRESSTGNGSFRGIRLWMMGGDIFISSSLHSFMDNLVLEVGGESNENCKAMKVLFTKNVGNSASGIWNDAEVIQLPLELCLQLWLVLQLSSFTLPRSKRYAQNCRVGYIRYA